MCWSFRVFLCVCESLWLHNYICDVPAVESLTICVFPFSPQINSIVGPFAVYWNVFDCQEHFMHVCSDILQGQT